MTPLRYAHFNESLTLVMGSPACALNLSLRRTDINSGGSGDTSDTVVNAVENARSAGSINLDVRDAQRIGC